jgi:hypothetical protein
MNNQFRFLNIFTELGKKADSGIYLSPGKYVYYYPMKTNCVFTHLINCVLVLWHCCCGFIYLEKPEHPIN